MIAQVPFWQRKRLHEMTPTEWESLCDGCGKCCLNKLEDEDTGEVYHTDLVCQYMDTDTCEVIAKLWKRVGLIAKQR